ncbi:MAG: hypothetical protein IPP42_24805 [Saprospiraceae bacterium]|nr:hypothetical protein [Saprospiraceae bacterium]
MKATATDNCSKMVTTFNYTDSRTNGTCPYNYTINRTWTATDSCGNISLPCSQVITVLDTIKPVIVCPKDTTIDCTSDTTVSSLGMATATDNCTAVVTNISRVDTKVDGDCPHNFTILRFWTAIDSCGNMDTCTQVITVQDTTNPVLVLSTCPKDTVVNCDEIMLDTMNLGRPTYFDNCTDQEFIIITFRDSFPNNNSGCQGDEPSIFRKFFATDLCGNVEYVVYKLFLYKIPLLPKV